MYEHDFGIGTHVAGCFAALPIGSVEMVGPWSKVFVEHCEKREGRGMEGGRSEQRRRGRAGALSYTKRSRTMFI